MAGLCEGGNEPPGSLSYTIPKPNFEPSIVILHCNANCECQGHGQKFMDACFCPGCESELLPIVQ